MHKLSQHDADRIEQHTGIPPEELEDDELEAAMDELGIEKQAVTPEDREVAQSEQAPPASGGGSYLDELKKAADLHEQGILSDEEFTAMKKKILGD